MESKTSQAILRKLMKANTRSRREFGVLVWLILSGCAPDLPRTERDGNAPTTAATLRVEPFSVSDSAPKTWDATLFADSLAARLGLMKTIRVERGATREALTDFTLSGDVNSRGGRLVLGVRLLNRNDPTPAWTATFWRSDGPMSRLVDDVATGAAEALGAEIARMSVSKGVKR